MADREWTPQELEEMADSAYRRRRVRCPICTGPVRSRVRGGSGRNTSWVTFYCERCRANGEYDPEHLEAMDLKWSREEMIRIEERYWAHGHVECPRDGAVLNASKSPELGLDPTPVYFNCPRCGRSFWSGDIEKLEDPDSFDAQYEVLDEIGQGGMGRVELVRHRATGRELAAKRIRPEFLRSEEAVRRFQREERILQRLSHDHIVPIERSFIDETGAVLLMPYLANGTLRDAIVGGTSPQTLARYFKEIAEGLEFLHSQRVIHRDLKPDNVLIDDQDRACIADFGLARLIDRDTTTLTARGQFLGTRLYAAPEQQLGSADVTRRCDIYALGLIAFEIAKRQSPYRLPIRGDGLAKGLQDALTVALDHDPEERTITAKELATALVHALEVKDG